MDNNNYYQHNQEQQIPIHVANNKTNGITKSSTNQQKKSNNNSTRTRTYSDTDSSYVPETTSESGISDLDMSEKCNCCPYGFHIDVDFVNFLETLDSKNLVKQLKKIQRKRNERLQRSMEFVIDEVEKIKTIADYENEVVQQPQLQSFPKTHQSRSIRRINDQSPSRLLITDSLKKTINEIDKEINRDFDAKLIIEKHKQRTRSNSRRRDDTSPSVKFSSKSRSPSHNKRSISRTSLAQSEKLYSHPTSVHSNIIPPQKFEHVSRSCHRTRSKSQSKSPSYQLNIKRYEYETRGGVATADEADEEMIMIADNCQNQIETTTQTYHQVIKPLKKTYYDTSRLIENPIDIAPAKEITLNIVSLASSNSSSSESLYSDECKLKINEIETPKPIKEKIYIETKTNNHELYRRIDQLEQKLHKIPELEIKNHVLIEERNMLLKQLNERQKITKEVKSIGTTIETPKHDIGIECKSKTRDVAINHERELIDEKKEEKFIEMTEIINTLREKLEEQTISMQKPATRDVAIMHQVDKIDQTPVKQIRDVGINHRTEDEEQKVEIEKMLIHQREVITNTYVKELEVLKTENVKLSATLEDAIKKKSVHVTTRGTSALEGPVLYSVGVNTRKPLTRDVQVMFTPKSRDVAMSTDRFYYSRDVSLYCNLDQFEEMGDEQFSSLLELRTRKRVPKEFRDVCIGVNCLQPEEPKVMRDVKIGVNLDIKELRHVSTGCDLDYKPKILTRDASMRVNLDEKQSRDICVGVNIQKETKDASMFVNTIEPVKLPEKPQQRNASSDTNSLYTQKDSCVGPDLQHLPLKYERSTDTSTLLFKRDVECGTMPEKKIFTRDFSTNVSIDDQEKLEMAIEISKLKMVVPKSTRDIGVYIDCWSRLQTNQACNTGTSMELPKLISKQQNTDILFKRESFTNTDKPSANISHKAIGDYNVNDIQISSNEYNSLKAKLNQIELEKTTTVKKEYKTQGVGLCSILDTNFEQQILASSKPITSSIGVGNDEFILNTFKRSIACGDCSIEGNFCDKCSTKTSQSKSVGTETIEKTGFVKSSSTLIDESIQAEKSALHVIRKETEYEKHSVTRFDGGKQSITKETLTVKLNDDKNNNVCERTSWETIDHEQSVKKQGSNSLISQTASIVIPVHAEKIQKFDNNEDNITTVSTEEVIYKDGQILDKRIIGKLQLKPKGILKTSSSSSTNSNVTTKALKFGSVISKRLKSASEESMSKTDDDLPTPTPETVDQEGEEGELHEIDEHVLEESIKSIKEEEEASDPNSYNQDYEESDNDSLFSYNEFELELELHIGCCILNESLYEPLKADKTKVEKALSLIQKDWFAIAAQKDSNPQNVMDHLNAFYSRFSNLLLERIVNMTDENFNTALHYSVSTGNFEIVNLLLDTKVCDVNAQNNAGYTSIMLAAVVPIQSDYDRQALKRLFIEGNVNIKSTANNQTALMLAVRHGNKEAVQLLSEANSDVNLQDKDGSTSLMAACEHGYIDIVRLLLDNSNCDPDIKDNDGETAFDICKKAQRNDIIVLLYAHSSKMRSHHPALQFSKSRPRIGSAPAQK